MAAKNLLLILFLILPAATFAQELKARALEPLRVSLTLEESESSADFNERLRAELRDLRRLSFVSTAVDFDIYIAAGPIAAGEKIIGHVAAVAVVKARAKDKPITVLLIMGPNLEETAKRTAQRINEEFFSSKR